MQRRQSAEMTARITSEATVVRARVRLKAWEALHQQLDHLDELPPREQRALLALALRYTDQQTAAEPVEARTDPESAEREVRQRLQMLAAGVPAHALVEQSRRQLDAVDEGIVDAEIVDGP